MKEISDAIVIGSGMIGSAAIFALTRAGMRRVTLVEKGPLVSGMTRRNAGLVHPFQPHPLLSDFALASYPFYSQWAAHLGGKSPFAETGGALVAAGDTGNAGVQDWLASAPPSSGITPLTPDAVAALFPRLTPELRAALYTPSAGYADSVLTAQALVNAAKDRGVQVHTGTNVKQILVEHSRIKGVLTTTGTIEAPAVVVAAGGWSERLLLPLGVTLHLQFRRGVISFYEQPSSLPQEYPLLIDLAHGLFLRPHPYHMTAAGSIQSQAQLQGVDNLDELITPGEAAQVANFVAECLPAVAMPASKRAHSIVYDTPADGLPVLGRVSAMEGLYVAAGFGTSAFAVAPAVGHALAQILTDGNSTRDVSAFDPMRLGLGR